MDPDAIGPLLAIEQELLRLLKRLPHDDPGRDPLLAAHEQLEGVLDEAVLRTSNVLAETEAILDRHRTR